MEEETQLVPEEEAAEVVEEVAPPEVEEAIPIPPAPPPRRGCLSRIGFLLLGGLGASLLTVAVGLVEPVARAAIADPGHTALLRAASRPSIAVLEVTVVLAALVFLFGLLSDYITRGAVLALGTLLGVIAFAIAHLNLSGWPAVARWITWETAFWLMQVGLLAYFLNLVHLAFLPRLRATLLGLYLTLGSLATYQGYRWLFPQFGRNPGRTEWIGAGLLLVGFFLAGLMMLVVFLLERAGGEVQEAEAPSRLKMRTLLPALLVLAVLYGSVALAWEALPAFFRQELRFSRAAWPRAQELYALFGGIALLGGLLSDLVEWLMERLVEVSLGRRSVAALGALLMVLAGGAYLVIGAERPLAILVGVMGGGMAFVMVGVLASVGDVMRARRSGLAAGLVYAVALGTAAGLRFAYVRLWANRLTTALFIVLLLAGAGLVLSILWTVIGLVTARPHTAE